MARLDMAVPDGVPAGPSVARIGQWAALVAFLAIVAYGVVQALQVIGVTAPPTDSILIFATSLCIAPPFTVAILALHYSTPGDRKFWSHGALNFSVMYAVFAVLVYVAQLASVIPASLRGDADPALAMAPHSLFWTIDALAYLCMGAAALFAVPVFRRDKQPVLWWLLVAHALMTPIIAVVYFWPTFSVELLFLGAPWLITAAGSTAALAMHFKSIAQGRSG